jgi:hypothetical protein
VSPTVDGGCQFVVCKRITRVKITISLRNFAGIWFMLPFQFFVYLVKLRNSISRFFFKPYSRLNCLTKNRIVGHSNETWNYLKALFDLSNFVFFFSICDLFVINWLISVLFLGTIFYKCICTTKFERSNKMFLNSVTFH